MLCFVEYAERSAFLYYDKFGDDMKRDIGINRLMEMIDDLDLEIVKSLLIQKIVSEKK